MTSFKDQAWTRRFGSMGDEAESVFEHVWPKGFVRYGLDRPPIHVHKLPQFVRYTPDYLTSSNLVEVQGFGRDRKVKVKHDKLDSLLDWNAFMPVLMFLWNNADEQWGTIPINKLYNHLLVYGDEDAFDSGRNPYRWCHAAELDMIWAPLTEPEGGHSYDVV